MNQQIVDERKPTAFLNYNGDVRNVLERGERPMGPSYMGEWWFPLTAEYDPETNKTHVGFTLQMPPEMAEANG